MPLKTQSITYSTAQLNLPSKTNIPQGQNFVNICGLQDSYQILTEVTAKKKKFGNVSIQTKDARIAFAGSGQLAQLWHFDLMLFSKSVNLLCSE